jgi:hypothetical protein
MRPPGRKWVLEIVLPNHVRAASSFTSPVVTLLP